MTGRAGGLHAYVAVTAAYWAFMLTDGALRMLVLLHFHELGFAPVELAYLFVLYEIAGMVTNLSAGWIAARFGMTSTLYAGLGLQVVCLGLLTVLSPAWSVTASVVFVMLVQGASGVAKDLAKMSSKSAVKLLAPKEEGALFRWVAILTGSKNAVKGAGFFLGAALLGTAGFEAGLWGMAGVLAAILVAVAVFMPEGLPKGRKDARFRQVFATDPDVNRLSLARVFLFGARDVWFVVGIPVYFSTVLTDGAGLEPRAAFFLVGGFMAAWIIGYGAVQGAAPRILGGKGQGLEALVPMAAPWAWSVAAVPAVLAVLAFVTGAPGWLAPVVAGGLLIFGVVFAINSSLHSYLILAFTKDERVTMDVGFYYMANAGGRLLGTVLSGVSYQAGGLALCLATAAVVAGLSALAAGRLGRSGARAAGREV